MQEGLGSIERADESVDESKPGVHTGGRRRSQRRGVYISIPLVFGSERCRGLTTSTQTFTSPATVWMTKPRAAMATATPKTPTTSKSRASD